MKRSERPGPLRFVLAAVQFSAEMPAVRTPVNVALLERHNGTLAERRRDSPKNASRRTLQRVCREINVAPSKSRWRPRFTKRLKKNGRSVGETERPLSSLATIQYFRPDMRLLNDGK